MKFIKVLTLVIQVNSIKCMMKGEEKGSFYIKFYCDSGCFEPFVASFSSKEDREICFANLFDLIKD